MRNDCKIVEDLLPVYVEDLCQAETAEFVSEHLTGCESCAEKYRDMKKPVPEEKIDKNKLSAAKRPLHKVIVDTALKTLGCIVAIILVLGVAGYAIFFSGTEFIGISSGRLEFFTGEYIPDDGSGKGAVIKHYTENGEELDKGDNYIRLETVNSFRYKKYQVTADSINGSWASNWTKDIFKSLGENPSDAICDGKVYIMIGDIIADKQITIAKLSEKDRERIEGIAGAIASIDEAVTQYAIKEYRDVFTEQVAIQSEIKEYHEDDDWNWNFKGNKMTIHFYGTGTGKDGKTVAVDDYLIFDINGWKKGVIPTYTIEKNRS